MVLIFSFFSSHSSSSRALLRDLVVLFVAAQFAVRIGNGFRLIRIRSLVRPHLSKLLYMYVLLFNAFSVWYSSFIVVLLLKRVVNNRRLRRCF